MRRRLEFNHSAISNDKNLIERDKIISFENWVVPSSQIKNRDLGKLSMIFKDVLFTSMIPFWEHITNLGQSKS